MSVDAFPIVLADEIAMSILCQNSLTDAEVSLARAALQDLSPQWSLECCESCEDDLFLDLFAVQPGGRFDQFIFHARDGAVHVFAMAGDEYTPLGRFQGMAPATRAVITTIAADVTDAA